MDGRTSHRAIRIARGEFVRIEDGKGLLVHLWDGALWITHEGDRRDYLVKPGDSFELKRHGVSLVYAMRRSVITVTGPQVHERARQACGWLGGLRHRMARLWADSYAPYSNPTTAGL